MADEYIIYCDESSEKGKYFSDFYGGALVRSDHIDEVKAVLVAKKLQLHFGGEVKWSKIPGNKYYAQKYITLMHCFFDLVAAGKIKVRIIFRQNAVIPRHLTEEQIERKYFILYHMFLKWAFGLDCSPVAGAIEPADDITEPTDDRFLSIPWQKPPFKRFR
jgi:hypothetical protein